MGNLRESQVMRNSYGPTFTLGDVVGCGWDIKTKRIYFTHNGKTLGPAFERVTGRFFPVVWVRSNHIRVEVNFGQQPFVFDFARTLPEGYLDDMQDLESKTKVYYLSLSLSLSLSFVRNLNIFA